MQVPILSRPFFAMKQWVFLSVHSNGVCQWALETMSFVKASARKLGRWLSGSRSGASASESLNSDDLEIFRVYDRDYFNLPGWFQKEAAAMWDCLLRFQFQQNIAGHLLEIGAWKGKSATCFALHAGDDEYCVIADRIILSEMKDTVGTIRKSHNLFIQGLSSELRNHSRLMQFGSAFRWIHIDGEHSGEAIKQDLSLAHDLINDRGIICVDDVPSNAYPQVYFAVVEYLVHHPDLAMFAAGHNKCYICRHTAAPIYLKYIRKQMHQAMTDRGVWVTIWKSGRPADCDCFGITDLVEDYDYRGPDWNPGHIDF